jgi:hypothetical protein
MAVARERSLQAVAVPRSIARRSEKHRALVVIDAVHDGTAFGQKRTHFRPNQPGRPCDETRGRAHDVKRNRSVAEEYEARIMRIEKRRPIMNRLEPDHEAEVYWTL